MRNSDFGVGTKLFRIVTDHRGYLPVLPSVWAPPPRSKHRWETPMSPHHWLGSIREVAAVQTIVNYLLTSRLYGQWLEEK